MKFNLTNKRALVTGGGSGIGKAISIALAEQGADVHILEVNKIPAKETAAEIKAKGGMAQAHACDVSNQKEVIKTINSIAAEGAIDILVNNAGIAHIGNVELTSEADIDRVYRVNIKGVYNCIYACIKNMKEKGGVIINMASVAATVGISDRFAYSMTKGAVLTLSLIHISEPTRLC